MRDTAIPTLVAKNEGVPIVITIPNTQALLADQNNTYNQAGFSYNQAGADYGGIYNQDENALPLLDTAFFQKPSLSIRRDSLLIDLNITSTNALLNDQGYTYNQAGATYDQALFDYGGIYNTNQDALPMSLSFMDIYSPFVVPPVSNNQSVGPGFFMFVTH